MKKTTIKQLGKKIMPALRTLWVKFDIICLADLQKKGYQYFVFVAQSGTNKLYPFKTYKEAIDKKSENARMDIQNNYIIASGGALLEIAKGRIAGVTVLI